MRKIDLQEIGYFTLMLIAVIGIMVASFIAGLTLQ